MDGILSQFANLDSTTKWWLGIAVTLTVFYAVMRPSNRKKKDPLKKAMFTPGLASQRSVEREMSHLLVELSEMARQVTAQLDTRAMKLDLLIKEADERIAALAEAARQASSGNPGAGPAASLPRPAAPSGPAVDPRHVEIYELADLGLSPREIAMKLGRPHGEVELILALRERSTELAH